MTSPPLGSGIPAGDLPPALYGSAAGSNAAGSKKRGLTGPFLAPTEVFALPDKLETLFLFTVGVLASTIVLKFASIQYLEYLYFLLMGWLLVRLVRAQFVVRTDPPLFRLLWHWIFWCVLALFTAVHSLGRPFYIFLPSLLHQPVWVSIARLGEVVANVAGLIYLGHLFRRNRRKLLFTMRVYFYTAGVSGLYSVLATIAARLGHHLPNTTNRANGFYNEGGPYGLYLITALALGLFLRPLEPRRKLFYASFFLCLIGLALSVSKAAYAAMLLSMLMLSVVAASWRQRAGTLAGFVVVMWLVFTQTPLREGSANYTRASQEYEVLSNLEPTNQNTIAGRTSGLFLIPKMVAAHPWLGVGFAHYGLVRNTPQYRRLSAFIAINDTTGLGILAYLAETGIPITAYLVVLLFVPFVLLRKTTHLWRATSLGLMQPVAHIMGAQLNLTYPWVMSAFAIGLTSWTIASEEQLEAEETVPTASLVPMAVALPLGSASLEPDSHLGGSASAGTE